MGVEDAFIINTFQPWGPFGVRVEPFGRPRVEFPVGGQKYVEI